MPYNLHSAIAPPPLSEVARTREQKTLRVTVPNWQGGTNPLYFFGSQLLAALVPPTEGPQVQVSIQPPELSKLPLQKKDGVYALEDNIRNAKLAQAACEKHQPDNVVVLGGDCLAELGPFSYLAHHYQKETFGILWLDAHPDVMNSKDFTNAHTYVLGNLLGKGDRCLTELVKAPVPGARVMIAGMHHPWEAEKKHIADYGVRVCGPEAIAQGGGAEVLKWIADEGITHLAIHIDLDVLSEKFFRMLYFCDPEAPAGKFDGIAHGQLRFAHIAALVRAITAKTNVVGLGITELLPWDAFNLREFLKELPLVNPGYAAKL